MGGLGIDKFPPRWAGPGCARSRDNQTENTLTPMPSAAPVIRRLAMLPPLPWLIRKTNFRCGKFESAGKYQAFKLNPSAEIRE